MSNAKAAVSFDDIIQADRQRRKNEELANEIFGRSRKAKDPSRELDRKQSRTPSFASRVGIAKRSISSTNVKPSSFNPPTRPSSATANIARTNRLATAVNNQQQVNVSAPPLPRGPGLSIKGAAGPFVVEASNFAPGTTAADIESALQTIATDSNGPIEATSCRIVNTTPNITAVMVFAEKAMADAVIKTFDGQRADGRILHVHHKGSRPVEPTFVSDPTPSVAKDLFDSSAAEDIATEAVDDVEMSTEPAAYSDERDRSDRERRDRDRDRDREPRHEGEDEHREDRNGSRRDERDRERERDRDHDRERDSRRYDDRRYERRDDRGSSSRGYGPPGGYDRGRPHGNGMVGFPRGRGGYNDGMAGGPPGGFRGGYRGFGRGRGF